MYSIRRRAAAWRRGAEAAHDIVVAHCRATGDTQQILADEIGVPLPSLNNWICGHQPLPMDVAVRLTNLTGRGDIARVFGSLTNYLIIPMPAPGDCADIAGVVQETGDVLRAYGDAIEDGAITEDEAFRIVHEIEEAQAALEAMKERVKAAPTRAPQLRLRM